MTEPPAPHDCDPKIWKEACSCARMELMVDALRHTAQAHLHEIMFSHSCEEVSRHPIYQQALEAVRADNARWERERRAQRELEAQWAALRRARLNPAHERAWLREDTGSVLGHQRLQLPVGQGGFHVGALKKLDMSETSWRQAVERGVLEDADFVYVYDCGSIPLDGVKEEIRRLTAQLSNRKLDMLFVSHFDVDHISGIPHLLNKKSGLQVDTVVMPYLEDLDRLISFARTADMQSDADDFHEDLVVDPVAAMQRFEPRQIVLVAPSGEEGLPSERGLPSDPPRSGPGSAPWKARKDPHWRHGAAIQKMNDESLLLKDCDFDVMADGLTGWRLKPYVRPAEASARDAFALAVEVLLEWKRGSLASKIGDPSELRTMVTTHRQKVARAYKFAFANKNGTSLSLYSGPASPDRAGAVCWNLPDYRAARVGWLGTGDADLRNPREVSRFAHHFSDELPSVSSFVLPHHGSIENYDPDNHVSRLDADVWITAARPVHDKWEHPHPKIVESVEAAGHVFKNVGRRPDPPVDERAVVFWSA